MRTSLNSDPPSTYSTSVHAKNRFAYQTGLRTRNIPFLFLIKIIQEGWAGATPGQRASPEGEIIKIGSNQLHLEQQTFFLLHPNSKRRDHEFCSLFDDMNSRSSCPFQLKQKTRVNKETPELPQSDLGFLETTHIHPSILA